MSSPRSLPGDLALVRSTLSRIAGCLVSGAYSPSSVAFLDDCDWLDQAAPRLRDLIEACVAGVLTDEATFEEVLAVNDATQRVLEAVGSSGVMTPGAGATFVPTLMPSLADLAGGGQQKAGREWRGGAGATVAPADDLASLFGTGSTPGGGRAKASFAPVAGSPPPAPAPPPADPFAGLPGGVTDAALRSLVP